MEQLKKLIKKKQYAEIVTYLLSVSDYSMIKQMISFLKKKELFISRRTNWVVIICMMVPNIFIAVMNIIVKKLGKNCAIAKISIA